VFISTNVAVLVLRRDEVLTPHFRVPTWVPVLGIASCLLLLSQQSLDTWLRAGILIVIGAVFHAIARAGGVRPIGADDIEPIN
jgi:hypothetical protein